MISKFRPIIAKAGIVAALAGVFVPQVAGAQDRAAMLLPLPEAKSPVAIHFDRLMPGVTVSSPIAFGPSLGDFYFGGGYQNKTRYKTVDDLSFFAGFGLGDPVDLLGVEVVITAASPFSRLANNRILSAFKVSRVLPYGIAVAAGIEGVKLTGGSANHEQQSVYGAASKVFDLNISGVPKGYLSSLTVNVGAGDGRFCPELVVNGVVTGVDNCGGNFFVSGGLRVAEFLSLVGDWYGQDLGLAASIVPTKEFPFVITPGIVDITGSGGDRARFVVGFGFAFKY